MPKINWTWTFILGGCAVLAWLSCYKIRSPVVFWNATLKLFVYALLLWAVCSVFYKIYRVFIPRSTKSVHIPEVDGEKEEMYKERLKRRTQNMQATSNNKTESYRERILKPREEEKKKKRDQELDLVLGHTFKGHGQKMGAEEEIRHCTDNKENVNEDARLHRRLPPDVILHRPRPEPDPNTQKNKHVIQLLEEPAADCEDVVTVTLHTPLDQRKSRRFLNTCRLQVILDYMTTLGFSQTYYTLSSSYPRQPLAHHAERTLEELKFERRTLLYVEEKE